MAKVAGPFEAFALIICGVITHAAVTDIVPKSGFPLSAT